MFDHVVDSICNLVEQKVWIRVTRNFLNGKNLSSGQYFVQIGWFASFYILLWIVSLSALVNL